MYCSVCSWYLDKGSIQRAVFACVAKISPAEPEASMKDRATWAAHRCPHRPSGMNQKFLAYILLYSEPSLTFLCLCLPYNSLQSSQSKILTHQSTTKLCQASSATPHPSQTDFPFFQHIQPFTDVSLPSLATLRCP